MIIFYLLIWLVQLAVPLLIVFFIIWLVKKLSNPKVNSSPKTSFQSSDEKSIRKKIATEIRAQAVLYPEVSQKLVVEQMAQTVEYFATTSYVATQQVPQAPQQPLVVAPSQEPQAKTVQSNSSTIQSVEIVDYQTPWRKLQVLDGAVILLYLGAFFVLSSIGLYIGLGEGSRIKAVLALAITITFYVSGLELYARSKRLKPAGLAFVAIGMATLPMAGAAIYYFALDKTNGGTVWLVTSIVAISMYVNALYKLRSTLVSYLVVFSTLSLVLSSFSVLGLTTFYFIQATGLAGILFAVLSRVLKSTDFGIRQAYDRSAEFLVPFSLGISVLFVARVGWLQLALSLFMGCLYYAFLWSYKSSYRYIYSLLSQLFAISASLSAVNGFTSNGKLVALTASSISILYALVWLLYAQYRSIGDNYRNQIKSIVLTLPLVAVLLLITEPKLLWMPILATAILSLVVYLRERDFSSGLGWVLGILVLPSLIGFVTFQPSITASSVSVWYLGILAFATLIKLLFTKYMRGTDSIWQQSLLFATLALSAGLQIGAPNTAQIITAGIQTVCLLLQAVTSENKSSWLSFASLVHSSWIVAVLGDGRLVTAYLLSIVSINLAIVWNKGYSKLHDWLVGIATLLLPLSYGLSVASPDWRAHEYFASYLAVFVLFLAIRRFTTILDPALTASVYLISLVTTLVSAFYIGPHFGLSIATVCIPIFLYIDKLENSNSLGYLAPLLPLCVLFHQENTPKLGLFAIILSTVASLVIAVVRKRTYESYLVATGSLVLPWYAGSLVYDWSSSTIGFVYLGLSVFMVILCLVAKRSVPLSMNLSPIRLAYIASLTLATIYAFSGSWQQLAVSLFALGLVVTAISYIENSPASIIVSFIYGYASILTFASGNNLGLTKTIVMCIFLSQSTYWVLRASGLQTIRAGYARNFQLAVAVVLPFIGLGRGNEPIYPIALALFSLMLMRETWKNGQNSREASILVLHSSVLWLLYALGVRELQVYTQSLAFLIGSFAYWRRRNEDNPALINQYLWSGALIFSVPMVWQAIASSNTAYAYLLLVEHVLLILLSIMYKRSTFAWWGIAIVVASVLYQLRKLRFAALAFLGVFIISIAVYFLLRYNKPGDQQTK